MENNMKKTYRVNLVSTNGERFLMTKTSEHIKNYTHAWGLLKNGEILTSGFSFSLKEADRKLNKWSSFFKALSKEAGISDDYEMMRIVEAFPQTSKEGL